MKNKITCIALGLGLILNMSLVVKAHEGHEHESENGTKLISNHPLTGIWTAKANLDESRKFHMGHEHKAPRPVILTLNLCGNGETLVGTVEQIKVIDAPKKLNVESAALTDIEVPPESVGLREYTILLNSLRDSDVAATMISTITDVAGEMSVHFNDEVTYYTAKQKKSKASKQCLDLLNPEHEDESDD